MTDQFTPTERNALAWVQFLEWYDKYKLDKDLPVLIRTRIAIQRQVTEGR